MGGEEGGRSPLDAFVESCPALAHNGLLGRYTQVLEAGEPPADLAEWPEGARDRLEERIAIMLVCCGVSAEEAPKAAEASVRDNAEEVLPRLVRAAAADPVREEAPPEGPQGIGILVMEVVVQQRPSQPEIRETQLMLRVRRLMRMEDLENHRFKVAKLRKSAKRPARMEYLDEVGLAAVEVKAAEVAGVPKGGPT